MKYSQEIYNKVPLEIIEHYGQYRVRSLEDGFLYSRVYQNKYQAQKWIDEVIGSLIKYEALESVND